MKEFMHLSFDEQTETADLIANWLRPYTHEVIVKVLERRDEIISNEFTMNLLRELKKRQEDEHRNFNRSIFSLMDDFDTFSKYDPHNDALSHAGSYRDVLYDMYIKD